MPDKDTILTEQNRTEQNRTEQHGLTAPFLRLAIVRHFKLHIDGRIGCVSRQKNPCLVRRFFAYRHKEE